MQQLAKESIAAASPSDCSALLLDVAPLVMRRIRREMRRRTMGGLSMAQFRTLNYLGNHPRASLSEVAAFLGLTPPSASKLVQRLVTQKVIQRRAGKDRRRVCLYLTESGRAAVALARQETHQQLVEVLQPLSPKQLATLAAALRILGRTFSEGGADVYLP